MQKLQVQPVNMTKILHFIYIFVTCCFTIVSKYRLWYNIFTGCSIRNLKLGGTNGNDKKQENKEK